jgi:hypothetical protein
MNYTVLRLELIWLKTPPMIGPRIIKAAITTMATKTRINAYSTRPWPFSLGENNIGFFSFLLDFSGIYPKMIYFTWSMKKGIVDKLQ